MTEHFHLDKVTKRITVHDHDPLEHKGDSRAYVVCQDSGVVFPAKHSLEYQQGFVDGFESCLVYFENRENAIREMQNKGMTLEAIIEKLKELKESK